MSKSTAKPKTRTKVKYPTDQSPLMPSVISTDNGNGGAEASRLYNGAVQTESKPHGRVEVSNNGMGGDNLIGTVKFNTTTWQGSTYAVGENITEITRRPVEEHRNSEYRYGSEHHLFGIFDAIARLKVSPSEPLTLLIPLPPGLMRDGNDKNLKRSIMIGENGEKDGKWTIAIDNKKPVTYSIERVVVPAEGLGAYAAYAFDLNGNIVDNDEMYHDERYVLGGHTVVFDLGYGTGDRLDIDAGRLNVEDIAHATRNDAGIQYHMVLPILKKVKEITGADHLTETHIDAWLRSWAIGGFTEDAAKFEVSGKIINVYNLFVKQCNAYAQWFSSSMLEPAFRDGADTILTAGGGWMFIEQLILAAFPKRTILTPYMFSHIKTVPVFSMNSYGGLALLAQNLRVHG